MREPGRPAKANPAARKWPAPAGAPFTPRLADPFRPTLLVFLGGVAWVAVGLVTLNNKIDSFQRVALPGPGEVSLDHSGGYVIYYEGPGAADGNVPLSMSR
jgi:hypothetical protein